ncbi:MAG: hypothetical protein RL261_2188 [Pseudomonadota bacterium]
MARTAAQHLAQPDADVNAPRALIPFGGDANAIQPGKRMLSSMSPTILLDHDGAFLPATLEALRQRGYTVEPHEWPLGDVQLIVRTTTGWNAAADPRGRGEVRRLP